MSIAKELERLAALHSQGHLTDEQFEQAKLRILSEPTGPGIDEPEPTPPGPPPPSPSDAIPVANAPWNALAVLSLGGGIVVVGALVLFNTRALPFPLSHWLLGIGGVIGLTCGYVALQQIKRRNERGRGLAKVGSAVGVFGLFAAAFGAYVWLSAPVMDGFEDVSHGPHQTFEGP